MAKCADPVAVQHAAECLEQRLAFRTCHFAKSAGGLVERRPRDLRRQLAHAQIAEADRIGERLETEIPAAQAMAQLGHALDVEILDLLAVGPHLQPRPVHQDAEGVPLALVLAR